jgi:hypothetical protein
MTSTKSLFPVAAVALLLLVGVHRAQASPLTGYYNVTTQLGIPPGTGMNNNWSYNFTETGGNAGNAGLARVDIMSLSPNSISLTLHTNSSPGPATHGTFDFTIPTAGTGTVSFNWNYNSNLFATGEADFLRNGSPTSLNSGSMMASGSIMQPVTLGDTFGFRLSYTFSTNNETAILTISNFLAPDPGASVIPEPGTIVIFGMGLLAAGTYWRKRTKASQLSR